MKAENRKTMMITQLGLFSLSNDEIVTEKSVECVARTGDGPFIKKKKEG